MSLLKSTLIATGIGGSFALFFLGRYKNASKEIQVLPSFSIPNFGLKGLTVEINLTIKNPTTVTLNIMYPFMRLMLGGSLIGSSQVINQVIKIPSYGEVQINKITIPISLMEELDLGLSLLSPLASGASVSAELVTVSALSFWFGDIAFERTTKVNLKKS